MLVLHRLRSSSAGPAQDILLLQTKLKMFPTLLPLLLPHTCAAFASSTPGCRLRQLLLSSSQWCGGQGRKGSSQAHSHGGRHAWRKPDLPPELTASHCSLMSQPCSNSRHLLRTCTSSPINLFWTTLLTLWMQHQGKPWLASLHTKNESGFGYNMKPNHSTTLGRMAEPEPGEEHSGYNHHSGNSHACLFTQSHCLACYCV